MCRVLAYLGEPILLEHMLYAPDVSFVNQTHQAALFHRLNLAGSGLIAWDTRSKEPTLPYVYRSTQLAIYDRNLRALARKVEATCLLTHLRGVAYDVRAVINEQNLHPFLFDGARLALAHNGQLARFDEMKFALLAHIKPDLARRIQGTTDSEWIYALLLSQLRDPWGDLSTSDIARGLKETLSVLSEVRRALGIRTFSPMNLFLSDGNDIMACCYTFDLGCYEGLGDNYHPPEESALRIWYTKGSDYGLYDGEWKMRAAGEDARSCIIASEPLTRDHDTWTAVPLQHLIYVRRAGDAVSASLRGSETGASAAASPGPSVEIVPLTID